MSYIDNTKRSANFACEITVCITKSECRVLLPYLKSAYKKVKKQYEKYEDIHESGEATERQENKLMKYTEALESLESILSDIDLITKKIP